MRFLQSRPVAFLFLVLGLGLIFLPGIRFPWKYGLIALIVTVLAYVQNGSLRPMHIRKIGAKEVGIAFGIFVLLELAMDFVIQPAISRAFHEPADYSAFSGFKGDFAKYIRFVGSMWLSAAIGEEFLFRGFLLLQLQKLFGPNKWYNVIIAAACFGLAHWQQGPTGIASTFIFGLVFGWMLERFKNIWINVIVHGLIDTFFLTLAYFGALSWFG